MQLHGSLLHRCLIFSFMPVSYTHLDVYKRQGLLACGKEHIDKESEINVYKEEYTPEKKHREDPLELKKGDSEICLLYTS